jgi:transcription-repair coupling factor (superfamily II helicase)
MAQETGIEKLILKQGKMACHFVANENSAYYHSVQFTRVLSFVQLNHRNVKMEEKNSKLTLTFPEVRDVETAIAKLKLIAATTVNENVQSG